MKSIKEVLMIRDGMTPAEADAAIKECRDELFERLDNGEMPEDILLEHFGLEDDYLLELIGF